MAKVTPMKAIRKHCIECSGGSYQEVALCEIESCHLFEYRFGKRPLNKQGQDKINHRETTRKGDVTYDRNKKSNKQ